MYFWNVRLWCNIQLWTLTAFQILQVVPNHAIMVTFQDHFGYAKLLCFDLISHYTEEAIFLSYDMVSSNLWLARFSDCDAISKYFMHANILYLFDFPIVESMIDGWVVNHCQSHSFFVERKSSYEHIILKACITIYTLVLPPTSWGNSELCPCNFITLKIIPPPLVFKLTVSVFWGHT